MIVLCSCSLEHSLDNEAFRGWEGRTVMHAAIFFISLNKRLLRYITMHRMTFVVPLGADYSLCLSVNNGSSHSRADSSSTPPAPSASHSRACCASTWGLAGVFKDVPSVMVAMATKLPLAVAFFRLQQCVLFFIRSVSKFSCFIMFQLYIHDMEQRQRSFNFVTQIKFVYATSMLFLK